jgi:hypothetical protein
MLVGVLALLLLSLHAGVFGARGQCLASLGLNQAPIHGGLGKSRHRTRVDVYVPFVEVNCREIFVMSKCPDAVDGEATIAKVMEKVGDKVALNVTYIVTYSIYEHC